MTLEQIILLIIICTSTLLYITRWVSSEVTSILTIAALGLTGVLAPERALMGFSSTATLTVAAMFVLSSGLLRTGALEAVTIYLAHLSQGNVYRLLLLLGITVPLASAFINNTPVVVMLIPVILSLSKRFRIRASKLLIPVSYFSILGGTVTLLGTSTNILLDDLYRNAGGPGFGLFDFAPLGMIYAVVGGIFILLFSQRLLPDRLSLGDLMATRDAVTYVTEVVLPPHSPLVGDSSTKAFAKIASLSRSTAPSTYHRSRRLQPPHPKRNETNPAEETVELLCVIRQQHVYRAEETHRLTLEAHDTLMISGTPKEIARFVESTQCQLATIWEDGEEVQPSNIKQTVVEAVVLPNSPINGRLVRGLELNRLYGIKIMGVQHRDRHQSVALRTTRLEGGDVLLLQGTTDALHLASEMSKLLIVEGVERSILRVGKYRIALSIMLAVVALATFTAIPIVILAFAGAGCMIVARCLRTDEALRALNAPTLLLLAATIPLGAALESSGLAKAAVDTLLYWAGDLDPLLFLSLFYLLTHLLTQIISNNAAVVLFTPIGLNLAATLAINPTPVLMAIAFGASASFLTPMGYQTNAIVMGPGGYTFGDYLRIGIPLSLLMWLTASFCIPLIWPL